MPIVQEFDSVRVSGHAGVHGTLPIRMRLGTLLASAAMAASPLIALAAPAPQPVAHAPAAARPAGSAIFEDDPAPAPPPTTTSTIHVADPSTPPEPTTITIQTGETPEESIERIYGARVSRAMNADHWQDSVVLAWQMFNDALQLQTPSPLQHIMLHKAYYLGMHDPRGYEAALASLKSLTQFYTEEKPDCDLKTLDIYERVSKMPHVRLEYVATAYVAKCREIADEKLKQNDTSGAINMYVRATHAERLVNMERNYEITELIRALREREVVYRKIQHLRAELNTTLDPDKAETLVKVVLVDWDDPNMAAEAIPLLDPDMRNIANGVLLGIGKLNEKQAKDVGDWYKANYTFATYAKVAALDKARQAYERALTVHPAHDVVWLEVEASLRDVQTLQANLARAMAQKRESEKRREIQISTQKNTGGVGGSGGTRTAGNQGQDASSN